MAIYKHFDTGVEFTTAELLKIYNDFCDDSDGTFDDFLFDQLEKGTFKTGGIILLDDFGSLRIIVNGLFDQAVRLMDDKLRETVHDLYDGDDDEIFLEIYMDMHQVKFNSIFTV